LEKPKVNVPENPFKRAISEGRPQIGLWVALADAGCAELCACAGFDWLLLDAEHGPNDLRTLLAQLQAIAPYPSHPIVRPPIGETHLIKQILEIGAQTLLIPMVENADQAAQLVAAMHYPPRGVRGVGAALARASRWTRISSYLQTAGNELCLLVQIETRRGLENIKSIASVVGVDGVFIGPADLSAAMGHLGDPNNPEMVKVIEQAIADIRSTGKAAGILITADGQFQRYRNLGCSFIAVGADARLFSQAVDEVAKKFRALV
jgi:4-hydroxy-2-oxoheptanedioate aldolase